MSRVSDNYKKKVAPELAKRFKYTSPMQTPRLLKIVLNTGVGEATQNGKAVDQAVKQMTLISGQKPKVTRSKKSISTFKLRAGLAIGCMVTLRGKRMWEFFDRLVSVALPRVRDFRGVKPKGFDGRGNFTMGLTEGAVFPEIKIDEFDKLRGMDITFVTTATTDEEGHALLEAMGMPFRQSGASQAKAA
jgi:large subunit ribosomal protein L5